MSMLLPLLETIRLEDGTLQNLTRHRFRMGQSLSFLGFSNHLAWSEDWVTVPKAYQTGVWKFRLLYASNDFQVEVERYQPRPISSLKLILADHLDYAVKYADRQEIKELFEKREEADDVLIVKNGLLTDTSYANIALYDGESWYTPAQPLLKGTRRANLIAAGKILPRYIRVHDLQDYARIRLFNAMLDFEEGPELEISAIF